MALINRLTQIARGMPHAAPLPQERLLPARFIADVVTARDRIPERVRATQPGYVHISSLIEFCPRRLTLLRREDRPLINSVTGGHRVMWRIGRAVEAHIREQYIASVGGHRVIGQWTCQCGATFHRGTMPAATAVTCGECQTPLDRYGEYTMYDEEAKLIGNPDMIPLAPDGTPLIVEIKSMNKAEWDALTAPKGDHILQAGLYYDLGPQNGLPRPHKEIVFIYCTKDFKYGDPYKEFHVDATTPALVRQRQALRAQVIEALTHLEAGTLPPRQLCEGPQASLAKKCPVVASCFNRS